MIQIDTFSLVLLALTLGTLVLLIRIAFRRRGAIEANDELPFWRFLRVLGVDSDKLWARAGQRGVHLAEMRCATCSSQEECAERRAAGVRTPASGCPNEALFRMR